MLEYESKEIFNKFDIPLVKNVLILKGEDIEEKVKGFSFPAIVKSQIAIGSRKKAGLIKIAKSTNEAISLCGEYFNRNIAGFQVEAILIEELVTIDHEYYCSIALDTSGRQFYFIASKEGGIDIEKVSREHPDAIIKLNFSYSTGLTENIARNAATQLGFSGDSLRFGIDIFLKLWEIAVKLEAQLVEINPLVMTPSGLIAVDGKMIIDDDAAFRQPIVQKLQEKKLSELEKLAKDAGFSFVELSGDIGILANGAGLTMALLDVLSELGLQPANFLDVGGGASKERVYKALELIFKLKPKVVLVNIFGGITRCDIVAQAIIQALNDFSNAPPMVIRLTGTNEKEGIALLKKDNIDAFQDVMVAVKKVKEVLSE
ncbi:MAG: succinate--CoA ligase subunit beta [Candidatus Lokiarchaeota archaeon]|nr:succinate--CoA ligase subunit beta [Candidatus Lokiarchaeota archaeon]